MDPSVNVHDVISCPYNKAHQVEKYRMHIHLQKCRKQYPNSGKVNCPFDATHVVSEVELDFHVSTCPARGMLDTQMFEMDDDTRPEVEVVPQPAPESTPDWEAEAHTSFIPDPSKKPHVIQKIKGATASERKKARMQFVKGFKPLEDEKK